MPDNSVANFPLLVSRERAGNKIGRALSLYVGRGRQFSVKELSNATGVKDRVIECALVDASSYDFRPLPNEALLSIACFLGADFTNSWLALAKQGAFDLPEDGDPNPGTLACETADDSARVIRAAIDGEFDGREKPDLCVVGSRMMKHGAQLMALSAKAA